MISQRLVVGFFVVLLGVASIADAQSSKRNEEAGSSSRNKDMGATSVATGNSSETVSFVNDVAPIINAKCGKCHVRSAKGRFDIKSYAALMDSDSIEPNQPKDSHFIEVIEKGEMPKGGLKVSRSELATIKKWIEEGAVFDGDAKDESQVISSMGNTNAGSARGADRGGVRGSRGQGAAAPSRTSGRRSRTRRGSTSRSSAFNSNALLKFLDTDGNGELSLAEIDAAKRLLYSLDVNEDDRLTGDEVNDLRNK